MNEIMFGSRSSKENYLKAILQLEKKTGNVRSSDIADHMGFSRPSVSRAMSELQKDGQVRMDEDKNIILTKKGRERAKLVLEKYIFLRDLLKTAGVGEPMVTDEACNMEHAISDETFLALRQILRDVVIEHDE